MSDERTDTFRDMWARTTTLDSKKADQYPIGATLEEQAKHTPWEDEMKHMPDQKMHKIVSFVKSGLRLVACILGMMYSMPGAFALLFMAEVVGIYEEMV